MKRDTVWPAQIPAAPDILLMQKHALYGLAFLTWATLGTSGVVQGLVVAPTGTPSTNVVMGTGSMYQTSQVDPTAWSALPIDTNVLPLQGFITAAQTVTNSGTAFVFAAPGSARQQIPYLVEAQLVVTDQNPTLLTYFNSANPTQAYSGPNNSGGLNYTQRDYVITTAVKTGGTFTTPNLVSGNLAQSASGGALSNGTYYFKSTYVSASGESQSSAEVSIVVNGGGSSQSITYTDPGFTGGATSSKVYVCLTTSGAEKFIGNVATTGGTLVVTAMPAGSAAAAPSYATPPTADSGWLPLAVVTQTFGETTVVSGDIFTGVAPTVANLATINQAISGAASGVIQIQTSGGILVNGGTGPFAGSLTISAVNGTSGGVNAYQLGGNTYAQVVSNIEAAVVNTLAATNGTITVAGTATAPTVAINNTLTNLTAQTAAISATTIISAPSNGYYRLTAFLNVTTGGTGGNETLTINAINTDTNTSAVVTQAMISALSLTATGYATGTAYFYAKSATNIQYSAVVGGSGTTGSQYNLNLNLERLS